MIERVRGWVPGLPRPVWALLAGESVAAVGGGMALPFLLVYLHRDRGLDLELAGVALALLAGAGFVANPLAGALADRHGARRTLAAGLLLLAAGSAALALAQGVWQALGACALLGFGSAVVWPAQDALLAELAGSEWRSGAFSVRYATMNVGVGVGGLLAALWAGVIGGPLSILFWGQALTMLAYALVLRTIADPAREPADTATAPFAAASYRTVLRDRALRRLLALISLLFAAGYAQYHAAVPAYATGLGGLQPGALGLVFAANTVTVVLCQLRVYNAVAGWRRSRGLAAAALTWALAWGIMLAGAQLGGGAPGVVAFAAGMAAFGVGETLLSPAMMPLVNDLAADALRGRYNAASALACTTGFMLGPLATGVALGAGFGHAFIGALVGCCLLAAAGAVSLERSLPAAANRRAGALPASVVKAPA